MDLQESWALTTKDLQSAAVYLRGIEGLAVFEDYLDHNELQLAADVLAEVADEQGVGSKEFWQHLIAAYEGMQLPDDAARCRLRLAAISSRLAQPT